MCNVVNLADTNTVHHHKYRTTESVPIYASVLTSVHNVHTLF